MLFSELSVGESGKIISVSPDFSLYTLLTDIGFTPTTEIECVLRSPLGDPTAYLLKGTVIALRREDAEKIEIEGGTNGSYL